MGHPPPPALKQEMFQKNKKIRSNFGQNIGEILAFFNENICPVVRWRMISYSHLENVERILTRLAGGKGPRCYLSFFRTGGEKIFYRQVMGFGQNILCDPTPIPHTKKEDISSTWMNLAHKKSRLGLFNERLLCLCGFDWRNITVYRVLPVISSNNFFVGSCSASRTKMGPSNSAGWWLNRRRAMIKVTTMTTMNSTDTADPTLTRNMSIVSGEEWQGIKTVKCNQTKLKGENGTVRNSPCITLWVTSLRLAIVCIIILFVRIIMQNKVKRHHV